MWMSPEAETRIKRKRFRKRNRCLETLSTPLQVVSRVYANCSHKRSRGLATRKGPKGWRARALHHQ